MPDVIDTVDARINVTACLDCHSKHSQEEQLLRVIMESPIAGLSVKPMIRMRLWRL